MDIQNRLPAAVLSTLAVLTAVLAGMLLALPRPVLAGFPETTTVCLGTSGDGEPRYHALHTEVARTQQQHRRGLMEREHLEENSGMLFVFRKDRLPDSGFWMYQTLIPLDIAYLDAGGQIVSIRAMTPCQKDRGTDCPSYPPGKTYRYALEVNQGYFSERGINKGDLVFLPADGKGCSESQSAGTTRLPYGPSFRK